MMVGMDHPEREANETETRTAPEVLVLQHLHEDGPGYLGEWLTRQGVSWRVLCTEAGEAYPSSVRGIRGLAVLGGAWSANDDRPSLRQAEALIREADALGIPVIGHCLGGQLMARAFGGWVQTLAQPEIGWLSIRHSGSGAARAWLGDEPEATVFQWHYDGFVQLPPGAELIAGSVTCAHQAFTLRQHLAMQFHVEITPQKISEWLAQPGSLTPHLVQQHPATVHSVDRIAAATLGHQVGSEVLARRIYETWRSRWKP